MKTKKFFLSNSTSNLFQVVKSLKGSAPKTNMVLRTYNNQLGDIQIKKQHSPKLFSSSFRFLSKRRTNFYSLYGAHKGLKAVKSSPQTLWVCGLKCGQGPHFDKCYSFCLGSQAQLDQHQSHLELGC